MCAAAEAPAAGEAAGEKAAPATTPAAEAPVAAAPAATAAPAAAAPMSDKQKMSYAIGAITVRRLKILNLDVDVDTLIQGIRDAESGHLALPEREIQTALDKMQADVNQRQQQRMKEIAARMKELGEKNKAEGPKFLEENKKKEGVVALPSGLEYKVLTEGEGKLPGPSDIVTVNYRGMFLDGVEFDSSARQGKPAEIALDGHFIPGMLEALKLMKVGSKWMIWVPPELAYKEAGMPPIIPPNAVLVFEVEVLGIKEKPPSAAPAP
jgi:FKBP-type peptidyl-prolyl cis-trans isomerase FklB